MFLLSHDIAETHPYTDSYTQDIDSAGGQFNDHRLCSWPLLGRVASEKNVLYGTSNDFEKRGSRGSCQAPTGSGTWASMALVIGNMIC
jgi:hypothetical protein